MWASALDSPPPCRHVQLSFNCTTTTTAATSFLANASLPPLPDAVPLFSSPTTLPVAGDRPTRFTRHQRAAVHCLSDPSHPVPSQSHNIIAPPGIFIVLLPPTASCPSRSPAATRVTTLATTSCALGDYTRQPKATAMIRTSSVTAVPCDWPFVFATAAATLARRLSRRRV
ncbi:hypothetical protein CCHR01_09455 [Colletotrichum chrysophilum]|uniref:Uncharacterized protein n=1 Tax=Colletotrichum chrysophilum TaxID=1836956 RepID=A0AAD9AGV0_9PEZI|nr:hypothetical protein CCHR01_09455 [Colletotrichum chrysophilum]